MERVIEMRISLDGIIPPIWREILVESSISFDELHETIQKAMGWEDYHAYEFQAGDHTITPDEYETITKEMRRELKKLEKRTELRDRCR